jgi:hypothetical protein
MHSHKVMNPRALARGLRHVELDDGDAFVPDFRHGFLATKDDDAEAFGEEFISAATSGESVGESARDELDDDLGGMTIELGYDEIIDAYVGGTGRKPTSH